MKIIFKNILAGTGLASLLLTSGCKKTLDINQDPNNPSLENGTPALALPAGIVGTTAAVGGQLAILGAMWGEYTTQSAASNQYKTIVAYQLSSADLNQGYSTLFANGLKNYQYILDKSSASSNWNFYLIASTMKAYTAQVLVDLYGSIPYSEALQGSANLNPKFDDGYSIYLDLLNGIDTALTKTLTPETLTASDKASDLIFGGDMDKWVSFANTLKLKMYLRMVKNKPAEAQAGIEKLYTDGANFLTENAAVSGFTDVTSKSNPMYEQNIRQLNTPDNIRASYTFVSWLTENADPRAVTYFGSANPGYVHQGDYTTTDPAALAAAKLIEDPSEDVILLSAAESNFMQAEAQERYFAGSDAKAKYDAGVTEAFDATGNDASAFIAPGGAYVYRTDSTVDYRIEQINTQAWASFPVGVHFLEGYLNRNRSGYPKLSPVYSTDPAYVPGQFVTSKNSALGAGILPQRLVYPDAEKQRNSNTPPQVPISTPVWWAQ